MIAGISSDGLRGILDGTLEGLTPLTILTGVNGSGKSTVLDALLIVESSNPEDAIAQAVRRRKATLFGSRWLVNGKARYASTKIALTSGMPADQAITLENTRLAAPSASPPIARI